MKLGNWFENFSSGRGWKSIFCFLLDFSSLWTENARKTVAVSLAGLVACKLLVDYVKNYKNERKILKFLSNYPEPFSGESILTIED